LPPKEAEGPALRRVHCTVVVCPAVIVNPVNEGLSTCKSICAEREQQQKKLAHNKAVLKEEKKGFIVIRFSV
jgi:hypothetical protein